MRFLGIDPGLNKTGWGVINFENGKLTYIADGVIQTNADDSISQRLLVIHNGLTNVVTKFQPDETAIEEIFVNKNPTSTLKLAQARGVAILSASLQGLQVFEYSPNEIKKTVVGTGHAEKRQIATMVTILLSGYKHQSSDSADALAIAICHAHSTGGKVKKSGIKTAITKISEVK